MRHVVVLIAAVYFCACASEAAAQSVQRPTRPSTRGLFAPREPTDPNRSREELTLTASLLAGYQDFLSPERTAAGAPSETTYTGTADASLQYWNGRSVRYFSTTLRAFSTAYSFGDIDPTYGADLDLHATTQAGRKNTINLTQMLSYDSSLVFGAFQPLAQTIEPSPLPDSSVGTGFVDQRSWLSMSDINWQRRWTSRQTTTANVNYLTRRYLNELGFDSDTLAAEGRYSWNFSRNVALDSSYAYSHSEVEDLEGVGMPVTDQTVDAGVSYSRNISPTRQIHFSGGGGGTYVRTQDPVGRAPVDYWTPSGRGMVRVDIGRSWSFSVDYRRTVSVVPGITWQAFATDVAAVRTDGNIGRRLEAVFTAGISTGRSGFGDDPARYEAYAGSSQLYFALARCCAMSLNYDYYYYQLHDIATLQPGLPSQYDRNAVYVGFSVWLPIFGASRPGERGPQTR